MIVTDVVDGRRIYGNGNGGSGRTQKKFVPGVALLHNPDFRVEIVLSYVNGTRFKYIIRKAVLGFVLDSAPRR
jgi:hypothetical protein